MADENGTRDTGANARVLAYYKQRPGQELHAADVAAETVPPTNPHTAMTVAAKFARKGTLNRCATRGTYKYLPSVLPDTGSERLPTGYTCQTVGNSTQGPVACGEDGALWVMRRL